MTESELILGAIESMRKSHDQCICTLREEMSIIQRASTVHLSSEMEVVNNEIRGLQKRMDKQNGNVASLQAESMKRAEVVKDFRELEKDISAVKRTIRTKWMLFLLGGIFFVVIITAIYDLGGFPKLFEWLINKVF